jgi:hypothetical protein
VEQALQFLIDKYPPLVSRLPLAPGTKEPRYGHLLAGEAALAREETAASLGGSVSGAGRVAASAALEQEVQQLRQQFEELSAQFAEFRRSSNKPFNEWTARRARCCPVPRGRYSLSGWHRHQFFHRFAIAHSHRWLRPARK